MKWTVTAVRDRTELQQILALQRENLAPALSREEARAQGFVTVEHTLETLEQMHALAPSIVVKAGQELAGYALTMPVEASRYVPILATMFQMLDTVRWRERPLLEVPYYVMGQVCVARPYRGQGVFDALYEGHRDAYRERFELLVTEIATRNTRSTRAHERVGFQPIHRYRDSLDDWVIVAWDWGRANIPKAHDDTATGTTRKLS